MSAAAAVHPHLYGVDTTPKRGPLWFLASVIGASRLRPSLKFESIEAVHRLREALSLRGETGREYILADALFQSCLEPQLDGREVYETLANRFQKFDRRQEEVKLLQSELPIAGRERELGRLVGSVHSTVKLIRVSHLAAACDAEGPWVQSDEKREIMNLIVKILVGRAIGESE